jgi:KDO2-lipid IV(A) lauroyltransferase
MSGASGAGAFAHDSALWRRFARFGAAHGPSWFVQHSPPVVGLCAALVLPTSRRRVSENLTRIRGPVGKAREIREVAETFASYAGCLAEALSNGSKNGALPDLEVTGKSRMEGAIKEGKGVIVVTAHTAGWELVGPVFRKHRGMDVVMVMEAERDQGARDVSDGARRSTGVEVAHVGSDPFASLPFLRRLRDKSAIAIQIDRVPEGMRGIPVQMFGETREVPEGPLRLAELSGAPIVPIFCARLGYRSYFAEVFEAVHVPRRSTSEKRAELAQTLAGAMESFVRRHPTQWFHFGPAAG